MKQTKESAVYLSFFKENIWLLLLPALTFAFLAYWLQTTIPQKNQLSALLEMGYQPRELAEKSLLTDEAVTVLRAGGLQKELGLVSQRTRIFKTGPVAVNVEIEGKSENILKLDLIKLNSYAYEKYGFNQVGQEILTAKKMPFYLFSLIGLVVGFSLGLIFSLVKTYLQKY